eukprot:528509-Rhodomonas_salina.1
MRGERRTAGWTEGTRRQTTLNPHLVCCLWRILPPSPTHQPMPNALIDKPQEKRTWSLASLAINPLAAAFCGRSEIAASPPAS